VAPRSPIVCSTHDEEDDWYEGMFIPKATLFLVYLWQCHRDPASYGPDAAGINTGRFLDEHGRLILSPAETHEDGHSTYGFGRLACVRRHAANDSLFIDISMVLWAARLEPAHGEIGKEIPPDTDTPVDLGTVL
jgi:cytochrome P450